MSKFDRVNVTALFPCCIGTVHERTELGTEGETIACRACNRKLQFINGIWTSERTGDE